VGERNLGKNETEEKRKKERRGRPVRRLKKSPPRGMGKRGGRLPRGEWLSVGLAKSKERRRGERSNFEDETSGGEGTVPGPSFKDISLQCWRGGTSREVHRVGD